MQLATQYYRPPFPDRSRWASDFEEIARTGVEAIGAWAMWGWFEPAPGDYQFGDLDRFFDEAESLGLKVIVTTGPEFNPSWLDREVKDSRMVDHRGHRVISATPSYAQNSVIPGACTDHPEVRRRVGMYLEKLATHISPRPNLAAWDAWCELDWAPQLDGHVCFCEYTVAGFRDWLVQKYGDLDRLNEAWHRRYVAWEDVWPGKQPGGNWTETMEYLQFLSWRSAENVSFRVDRIRHGDPTRMILAHTVIISSFMTQAEGPWEQALARGNDWEVASRLDGFGASHFPNWFQPLNVEYGARLESARCAAGDKPYWVCELQGGAAGHGFVAMPGVPAAQQQRWIWTALARGAKTVVFWCWRDEVFGRESGGFGVAGNDGYADERVTALTHTSSVLKEHKELLDNYSPDPVRTAVIFDGANHQLEWSFSGVEGKQSGDSVFGYLLCLERLQIPYDILEASHLGPLDRYRVLFMPWPMIVKEDLALALNSWVEGGGTLIVESELDAFDELGLYRYPEERPFPRSLGIQASGRRPIDTDRIPFNFDGVTGELRPASWLDPLISEGDSIADTTTGTIISRHKHGSGQVIAIGTHAALAYRNDPYPDFEQLIDAIINSGGGQPELICSIRDGETLQWRTGLSGDDRLIFITNTTGPTSLTLTGPSTFYANATQATDLITGTQHPLTTNGPTTTLQLTIQEDTTQLLLLN